MYENTQQIIDHIKRITLIITSLNTIYMKTKFIKFSKLPRIQSQADHQSEIHSRNQLRDVPDISSSPFRKTQSQKYNQLLEVFDGLMKKSIKQVKDFELEARDRSVVVDLPELQTERDLDDDTLKEWITDVCSNVFSSAFHSLSKDEMNYEHTKIFCSQGILRNIVLLTRKFRLTEQQIKIIDDLIEQKIVPYMKRKYPMTESSDVSKAIDESVKPIDNREALQNDFLQKSDVVFTYRQSANYNDLIMQFINWSMNSIDAKANETGHKTVYEEYYDNISKIFENVYSETWMNSKLVESSSKIPDTIKIKVNSNPEEYAAEVKEYTHYAIGRKLSKNIPLYNEEEINSGHLTIKHPSILRILTKWCEQLWEKFTKKNYFLDREENLRVQEKDGNTNTMFMWMKLPLNDMIEEEKRKIETFMREVEQNNYDQQSKLLLKQLERDGFCHIEKIQKACGKFAYKTVNNLHCYIILYLNRIIHGLLSVSKKLYDTKLSSKARWTSPPDLLSFKIGDLMRCKCSSKQREILKIFQQLERITDEDPKLLKIIRVNNRLKQGTNDILVNVLYKEKFLCEIQLAVKATQSKWIQCSNMFNHYIYELGRTLFGPLTELCSVWMSLDARAGEYSYCIKNEQKQLFSEPIGCKKLKQQHKYVQLDRPFVCSDCNLAYSHTNYIWIHQKCTEDHCNHMICATCRIQNQNEQILKQKLLAQQSHDLRQACRSIINRKSEKERVIPTYGVCIQIQSRKIKIQKFKKLEVKKIMTIYGIKKGKNGQETITLIDEVIKKDSEKNFLKKYLVFQIPDNLGPNLIDITLDRVKKDFIIPQKVKQIYKKEKEILSLIEQKIDDASCEIMRGTKDGMEHIKNMELADNLLTKINFITQNFPKLERLQLSRNKINNIDTISKLNMMTKLNLRDNQLKSLPDQICQLQFLQGLNIRNNQLTALPEHFGNLKLLNKLESDNNQFTDLPASFQKLVKLKFIDLSKNKFNKFPPSFQNFTKLKQLSLSNNKLEELPNWIQNFKDMITLDLSKTKLRNLPNTIYKLINLQILKIDTSHNKLEEDIMKLSKLKQLCIQMPNLVSLPTSFQHLANLETLQIEDCQFDVLPSYFSEMKKLITFSLINNKIEHLFTELTEMVRLKYLRIEGQNISDLPQGMEKLVQLRTLSLNNNKFHQIPAACSSFNKLYTLNFKNNMIASIDDEFFMTLPDIETLALDNNKLKTLPMSIQFLKKLKTFTYSNNEVDFEPPWAQAFKKKLSSTQKAGEWGFSNNTGDSKIKG